MTMRMFRWALWGLVAVASILVGIGWGLVRTKAGSELVTRVLSERISGALDGVR